MAVGFCTVKVRMLLSIQVCAYLQLITLAYEVEGAIKLTFRYVHKRRGVEGEALIIWG